MIADSITLSRILFSLLLFWLPTSSRLFWLLYLLCGLSDMLDGFVARRLHTESERGARLDSAADLVFAAVYAVKILTLLELRPWIWAWAAVIAAVKLTGILLNSLRDRSLSIPHSRANKLTGLLLFLLPLLVCVADVKYSAALVCAAATWSAVGELYKLKGNDQNEQI